MTYEHIPFKRRFIEPSRKLLRDPDYLSIWRDEDQGLLQWDDLLNFRCVVVLGEGRCGKTHEFKTLHNTLTDRGKYSFFVPLELLQDHDLVETIPEKDELKLKHWLTDTDEDAFFFLDAVDELKLRKGTLRKAIRKIKDTLGTQLNRSKFFVSCRPNDWEEELDLDVLRNLVLPKTQKSGLENGIDIISSVISGDKLECRECEKNIDGSNESIKVLFLLPLSQKETAEFAKLYAPDHAEYFKTHLQQKDLWHIYQLPAEIISALDQLDSEGRLGNLEEQLAFGIAQKLRETSDKKRNSLSELRAKEGTERIALALFLMKRRSIYLVKDTRDSEGVCVSDILTDWTLEEQLELLGKSLFDPIGVGAVRFHHRSTQEFLAAKRIHKLQVSGLSTTDLFTLLFADIGQEQVIVPSMEPLVAWMALWNHNILSEVKSRNPILLFRQGIPAALSIDLRASLIRQFVRKFSNSDWRGIGIGHNELKRVATPELSPVVRELWKKAYSGHDTRELLLDLIYASPMPECEDLALEAAFDSSLPDIHRIYGHWTVLNYGTKENKRKLGLAIIAGEFPERVVRNALPELLPIAVNIEEFILLARSLTEIPNSVHGLGYALLLTVKSEAINRDEKIRLRDNFSKAIWDYRTSDSRIYEAHSAYDHFCDAVIAACNETQPTTGEDVQSWVWSLSVALQFGERTASIIAKDETEILLNLLSENISLREAFFWASAEIAKSLKEPNDDWHYFADYNGLIRPFQEPDLGWLLHSLGSNSDFDRRSIAFNSLLTVVQNEEKTVLTDEIYRLISDRPDLCNKLEVFLNPLPSILEENEIEHQKRKKERLDKKAKKIEEWKKWIKEVLLDKDFLLGVDTRDSTLSNLYKAIKMSNTDNSRWGHWDAGFVEATFSKEFLDRIRQEFAKFWRNIEIQLYSEREKSSRGTFSESFLIALTAIKCDSEKPDWAKSLTYDEAVKAVRISMMEINGFGSFLSKIEAYHPDAVLNVVSTEVKAQIDDLQTSWGAPILHNILFYGSTSMQNNAANIIAEYLTNLVIIKEEYNRNDVKFAFEIIASHGSEEALQNASNIISNHLDNSDQDDADEQNFWLRIWGEIDPESACKKLIMLFEDFLSKSQKNDAIALFAAIFGRRHTDRRLKFDHLETGKKIELLRKLVILAYKAVKIDDDIDNNECHSSDIRDFAEEARSYLLHCLATTKSTKTLFILKELSSRSEFSQLTDRLKQMATELAAEISEPEGMNAATFRKLDQETNYLPYDNNSLFLVTTNRLKDFEYHLINDEQSIIDTLRKVDNEIELRRFISAWLTQNGREAYTITQEAVTNAEKRTDIRLHASNLDSYSTIELKLDDSRNRWSGAQLKEALIKQLAGLYLNHERCQVGCLLICMREERKWVNPDTGARMDLGATVDWLQNIANKIMDENPSLLVAVMGIDYSKAANE